MTTNKVETTSKIAKFEKIDRELSFKWQLRQEAMGAKKVLTRYEKGLIKKIAIFTN